MNTNRINPNESYVVSYLVLREAIGILGLALPVILVLGSLVFGRCSAIQHSISHYYYSIMHIAFVGILCVVGAFLVTYRGTSAFENRVSNFAGTFAFVVAVFPTGLEGFKSQCQFLEITIKIPEYIGWVHYGFAGLLFTCFAIFCLKIFQDSDNNAPIDKKKIRRNKIYKVCGWGIIVSMTLIALIAIIDHLTHRNYAAYYSTTLIFETTSLFFFGSSWLIKGSLLWKSSSHKVLKALVKKIR